jgi:hypothetical protein
VLGSLKIIPVPIPADCTDGFLCANWNRPQNYLNKRARSAISAFSQIRNANPGLQKLAKDLESGKWHERYRYLQQLDSYDFGYRLLILDNLLNNTFVPIP